MENFGLIVLKDKNGVSFKKDPADIPAPPGEFGVLWETHLIGICQTDREHVSKTLQDGQPHHLIHEIVGKVLQVGPGVPKNIRPGTVVVPLVRRRCQEADTINALCEPHVCAIPKEHGGYRSLTDYGFRKYSVDCYWNLMVVPEELANDDIAALAEPMSLTNKIINEVYKIKPSWGQNRSKPRTALVAGAGIGLLMAFVLKVRGFNVIVIDNQPSDSKRHSLLKLLNIPHTMVDVDKEVASQLTSQGVADSFDLVVDATGSHKAMEYLLPHVAMGGIIVAFSLPSETWIEKVCRNNITIIGNSKQLTDDECKTKALKLWQLRVGNSTCIKRTSTQVTSANPSDTEGLIKYQLPESEVLISRSAKKEEFETQLKNLAPNSVAVVLGDGEGWTKHIVERNITILGCVNFGAVHAEGAWDDLLKLRKAVGKSIGSLITRYSFTNRKRAFANHNSVRAVIKIE